MDSGQIKNILEAAILVADTPLSKDAMLALFDEDDQLGKTLLNQLLAELAEDYSERGVQLQEVASGFRFQARPQVGPWVSRLWQEKAPRYSRAVLETLALVAYRQPITRGEIEDIRGVAVSSQIMKGLLERNWVRVVGHRDVPGRPAMFATTRQFLDYFNLKSLEELPTLAEIRDLDKINEELALTDKPDDNAPLAGAEDDEQEARLPSDQESFPGLEDDEEEDQELMSMDKVDAVLADFEAQFRRKPAAREEDGHQQDPSGHSTHTEDA